MAYVYRRERGIYTQTRSKDMFAADLIRSRWPLSPLQPGGIDGTAIAWPYGLENVCNRKEKSPCSVMLHAVACGLYIRYGVGPWCVRTTGFIMLAGAKTGGGGEHTLSVSFINWYTFFHILSANVVKMSAKGHSSSGHQG